jgi:hypothetical protein
MSKQMTAVEWLEQEFIALQNYGVNELGLFEKAKEMEKLEKNNYICIKCKFKIDEEMHKVSD